MKFSIKDFFSKCDQVIIIGRVQNFLVTMVGVNLNEKVRSKLFSILFQVGNILSMVKLIFCSSNQQKHKPSSLKRASNF